jgi:hypothetical protein
MATRSSDGVQRRPASKNEIRGNPNPENGPDANAEGNADNELLGDSLQPGSPGGTPSEDPSPFSRSQSTSDARSRYERIAQAAYRRAEQRGFAPGQELEDWLSAEREIDGETRSPPE